MTGINAYVRMEEDYQPCEDEDDEDWVSPRCCDCEWCIEEEDHICPRDDLPA